MTRPDRAGFWLIGLAAACMLAVAVAPAAGAQRTHTSVSIKLASDLSRAHGSIDSSMSCQRNRAVKLYYAFNGSTSFSKVSSDVSDSFGHWSIPGPDGSEIPSGQLYAKVPKKGRCNKARSKTLKAPRPAGFR